MRSTTPLVDPIGPDRGSAGARWWRHERRADGVHVGRGVPGGPRSAARSADRAFDHARADTWPACACIGHLPLFLAGCGSPHVATGRGRGSADELAAPALGEGGRLPSSHPAQRRCRQSTTGVASVGTATNTPALAALSCPAAARRCRQGWLAGCAGRSPERVGAAGGRPARRSTGRLASLVPCRVLWIIPPGHGHGRVATRGWASTHTTGAEGMRRPGGGSRAGLGALTRSNGAARSRSDHSAAPAKPTTGVGVTPGEDRRLAPMGSREHELSAVAMVPRTGPARVQRPGTRGEVQPVPGAGALDDPRHGSRSASLPDDGWILLLLGRLPVCAPGSKAIAEPAGRPTGRSGPGPGATTGPAPQASLARSRRVSRGTRQPATALAPVSRPAPSP